MSVPTTPSPDRDQVLLTITEAAAMLRVSRWMLYRLIQTRQLRTVKLGRRRLVPRGAIDDLIAALSQQEDA